MSTTADSTADLLRIADMTEAHLPEALRLSRAAGWPHRLEDWRFVLQLGSGKVALSGEAVVGTTCVTPFGESVATVNMIIVDAAMRGRGVGRKVMEAAMALAAGRELRLVATPDGRPLYEKLGFTATGTIFQHQGNVSPPDDFAPVGEGLRPACTGDMAAIAALDAQAFGAMRAALIGALFACGQVNVLERHGSVTGFAVRRAFGRGLVVGPVVATRHEDALALIGGLCHDAPGDFIRLDVPETSGLSAALAGWGLVRVDSGLAMRRNPAPGVAAGKAITYALASQALG
ncbi:GNAT superfamily N-acetyltransferase [Pseudochelatococcus lubricantis]|uniref:GNAT superfamily N-acetyltransferase n=1 Tax=Pseudochelatococcus lubricantis TaxID=1538102 RepID=A0ABX0UZ28_9HYPH|nr:GNAT family N-acetyltransferase [Pseudochelatococcus lubricantis]NIJ57987.1 GNAT superfamily N-acetyltransferase [Pseudochelatococcus lubricantis]